MKTRMSSTHYLYNRKVENQAPFIVWGASFDGLGAIRAEMIETMGK
jgi:hypothetical protein